MITWSVIACVLVAVFLRWTGWSWVAVIGIGALLLVVVGATYFVLISSGMDLSALDRRDD
jgi:hypothetical protein